MFKQIAIYDMDGTIVDSSHRYRTITHVNGDVSIDLPYWRDNEYKAMSDGLLPLATQYMLDIASPDIYVIIATARILHNPDKQFIREILGLPDYIISRGISDIRSGKELKIKGLQKFFNLIPFQGIDAVFYEDNIHYLKAVCDHFQIRGVYIPSIQGH